MQAVLPFVLQLWALPLLAPLVSVAYYLASPEAQPSGLRLLASAHGMILGLVYLVVVAVTMANGPSPAYVSPFVAALGVAAALMVTSLFVFRGRLFIHLLQLLNVLCLLLAFLFGAMALTGEGL
jgi:hypothetical protein